MRFCFNYELKSALLLLSRFTVAILSTSVGSSVGP